MCSIRNGVRTIIISAAGAAGLLLAGGCQFNVPPAQEKLNDAPLLVDEAMQKRDWDRSVSYYANGDAVAGGTGYMFQTHETIPPGYRRLTDPGVAAVNIVALPVGVFVNSPFGEQTYQGVIIPPSYTTQPPLP